MANSFFQFKQFTVHQDACAMKVCTDACLFGAWCAAELEEKSNNTQTLLDAGTGTGLLALMIRQKNMVQIDAVEIDGTTAMQALQNIAASPWQTDIKVVNSDILDMGVLKRYDYIISNPPFYETDLKSPDHNRNTAHHSSALTLEALLYFIAKSLQDTGRFFLLLPYRRQAEIHALLQQTKLHLHLEVLVRQTKEHAPFRVMIQGGFEEKNLETSAVTITEDGQQYTAVLTALLKDYYLYL
jgi:tRNA1Val (adenine37-N6)-methyltransferase